MITIQRNQTYNCNSGLQQPGAQPWLPRADAKRWVPGGTLGTDQENANVTAAIAWERQQLELERRLRQLELDGFNLPTTQGFNPPTTKKSTPRAERKKGRKETKKEQQLKEQDWHQFCATQKGASTDRTHVIPKLKQYACLAEGCKALFGNWSSCVTHMRSGGCDSALKSNRLIRQESVAKVNKLFLTDPEFMIVNIGPKGVRGFESEEAAYEGWVNGMRSSRCDFELDFEGFVSTFLDGKAEDVYSRSSWYSTRRLRKEAAASRQESQLNHITLDAWKARQQSEAS